MTFPCLGVGQAQGVADGVEGGSGGTPAALPA